MLAIIHLLLTRHPAAAAMLLPLLPRRLAVADGFISNAAKLKATVSSQFTPRIAASDGLKGPVSSAAGQCLLYPALQGFVQKALNVQAGQLLSH
jgi:hypothetical protein